MSGVAAIGPCDIQGAISTDTGGRVDAGAIVSGARLEGHDAGNRASGIARAAQAGHLDAAAAGIEDAYVTLGVDHGGGIAANTINHRGAAPGSATVARNGVHERAVLVVEIETIGAGCYSGLVSPGAEAGCPGLRAPGPPTVDRAAHGHRARCRGQGDEGEVYFAVAAKGDRRVSCVQAAGIAVDVRLRRAPGAPAIEAGIGVYLEVPITGQPVVRPTTRWLGLLGSTATKGSF
jgi:hypothetical protein